MRNIYILSTDKQIKNVGDLVKDQYGDIHIFTKNDGKEYGKTTTKLNIYITSDYLIKAGDWCIDIDENIIFKVKERGHSGLLRSETYSFVEDSCRKIILTTDQDLIKDGVQAIDDEFLEWFIKNPSCEKVEVKPLLSNNGRALFGYKIIIPKEEPKQETLEEAVYQNIGLAANQQGIINQALATSNVIKVLQERMYSEEDMRTAFFSAIKSTAEGWNGEYADGNNPNVESKFNSDYIEWFEQFKKK